MTLDTPKFLLCLHYLMRLSANFQVVFWTCVWSPSLFVFRSHKTLHVGDATRTQHTFRVMTRVTLPLANSCISVYIMYISIAVVGWGLGGRSKTKKGPSDDVIIVSQPSLRYDHPRILFWDYGMTDIVRENAKECSWCTIQKTLKVGKPRVATHKSQVVANWHFPISLFWRPISLHSPSINCKVYHFESFTPSPLKKCLLVGILNLFTLMSLWESIKL